MLAPVRIFNLKLLKMSKLKKLKEIQKTYSEQLVTYVADESKINTTAANALIEAVIYEVLNIVGK